MRRVFGVGVRELGSRQDQTDHHSSPRSAICGKHPLNPPCAALTMQSSRPSWYNAPACPAGTPSQLHAPNGTGRPCISSPLPRHRDARRRCRRGLSGVATPNSMLARPRPPRHRTVANWLEGTCVPFFVTMILEGNKKNLFSFEL